MKVFIHLSQGIDGSYLLTFPKHVTRNELRRTLSRGYDSAVPRLLAKSQRRILVPPQDRQKARHLADFVLAERHTTERLA